MTVFRLPDAAHTSRPWRIHELTRDFEIEDVWALPTPGDRDDFPLLVRGFTSGDASAARRDPCALSGGSAGCWESCSVGIGRTRGSVPGFPRCASACRLTYRSLRGRSSNRFPSSRCICSTTSSPLRSPTGPSTGSCTSAGFPIGRAAIAVRWPCW